MWFPGSLGNGGVSSAAIAINDSSGGALGRGDCCWDSGGSGGRLGGCLGLSHADSSSNSFIVIAGSGSGVSGAAGLVNVCIGRDCRRSGWW